MKRKYRRLRLLAFCLLGLSIATALALNAFRETLIYFYSPADLVANGPATGKAFRLGGMVEKNSVRHEGTTVTFTVTDYKATLPVTYTGVLPDLFREGQGVVAEGKLGDDGVFHATTILAKHDERYMPPEVAKALGKPGNEHHETDTLVTK